MVSRDAGAAKPREECHDSGRTRSVNARGLPGDDTKIWKTLSVPDSRSNGNTRVVSKGAVTGTAGARSGASGVGEVRSAAPVLTTGSFALRFCPFARSLPGSLELW